MKTQTSTPRSSMARAAASTIAMGLALAAGLVTTPRSTSSAWAQASPASARVDGAGNDTLIFRNGNTLKGEVVKETDKTVTFKSSVNGIDFQMEYQKSDVLSINRAAKPNAKPDAKGTKADAKPAPIPEAKAGAAAPAMSTDAKDAVIPSDAIKYYFMDLRGEFGSQITQTPMKDAIDDAYEQGAEVLIFAIDADWSDGPAEVREERKAFEQEFNIFRAVPVNDVFLKHIPSVYGEKRPKVVFWVKNAMGAAAFVPMVSCDRYFHPDGKMGGIGNLSYMHRGSSERVKEKWRGASLKTAVAFANWGCVPEIIIRAMSRIEQVLSVRYVNGKPEFFEDYPSNPGEELLTDSGNEAERDNITDLARWRGNDVLTLTAEIAEKLQLSKGTIATKDELLDTLGLARAGVAVDGRVDSIIKRWADGLEQAKSRLLRLQRDYADIEVQGEYEERRAARGRQQRTIDEMISVFRRFGEGLQPRWLNENNFPMTDEGAPDIDAYLNIKDRIKTDQQLDKR